MVFEDYADFYDWLYRDKDYRNECDFLERIFATYSEKEIKTILDLGCGTGSHTLTLSALGYSVTGVDCSEKMLRIAEDKARQQKKKLCFLKGDIRHIDIPQRFDAVIAMFNVLGYQTTNQDVVDSIQSARRHLHPGGLFIFDVWFGPAVLRERPGERVKNIEKEDGKIVRYVYPVLDIINQTIQVNYTVSEFSQDILVTEVKESHVVRFFFYQELLYFLERNKFKILKICPFLDLNRQVDEHSWNISVISRGI